MKESNDGSIRIEKDRLKYIKERGILVACLLMLFLLWKHIKGGEIWPWLFMAALLALAFFRSAIHHFVRLVHLKNDGVSIEVQTITRNDSSWNSSYEDLKIQLLNITTFRGGFQVSLKLISGKNECTISTLDDWEFEEIELILSEIMKRTGHQLSKDEKWTKTLLERQIKKQANAAS